MKRKTRAAPRAVEASKDLFDPIELEILNRYFGLSTSLERAQLVADPADAEELEALSPGAAACAFGVRLEDDVAIDCEDKDPAVARAVGRICLQVVGRRRDLEGRRGVLEVIGDAADDWPEAAPYPAPLLFSVDWAMLSWEERYYAVLVPGFDRYVVVKASSPEVMGGAWLALGWFKRGRPVARSVGEIVKGWWHFQAEQTQPRWESFLEAGLVSRAAATAWADEVWEDVDEFEDGSEEDDEETEETEEEELDAG